ncbi:hypothetical protein CCAN11_1060004 [Capnocytophaga canimorsus]|uniref:Uncharacterized protein n=1 Tax=Capnocytophaga canimorsus TaxID=28188 RepID=A0A0B7I6N3_9FLAO|nr:hypothetical protein CCAN11_1060004 [Capnocytophaga canimorsus]
MKTLYTLSIYVVGFILKIIALFNKKIKLFVQGRKNVFPYLKENIQKRRAICLGTYGFARRV